MNTKKKNPRNAMLAKIHIAKKQLGIDDTTYREMLQNVTKKDSCSKLTDAQLRDVLKHLKSVGFKPKANGSYPGRPKNMDKGGSRARQLKKIEAQIADAGYPWIYADVLARRICKVDSISWVETDQLYKIITAFKMDAQRKNKA